MTDVDDFTDYTESCSCGHSLRQHGNVGGCSGTRTQMDRASLPAPVYADESNPFEWPSNWPPVNEVPTTVVPCTCSGFGVAEPEPPEDWS